MYDDNNIFAKIIRKEIPCTPVYEDEKVLFINDINPQAKIHILAIPKNPVVNFRDFAVFASQWQKQANEAWIAIKATKLVSEPGDP